MAGSVYGVEIVIVLFVVVFTRVALCKLVTYGTDAMFRVEVIGSDTELGAAIAIELVLFPVLEFWGAVNGFVCDGYSILFSCGVGSFPGYAIIWGRAFLEIVDEFSE